MLNDGCDKEGKREEMRINRAQTTKVICAPGTSAFLFYYVY